jgi:uncharacterized protein YecE (DUF72 family)
VDCGVRIGCPLWAHTPWVGRFFTADARREDFLPQYASVFRTTEGNATFYGLPSAETVARWAAEAPPGFRFCFKFPRTITHERALVDVAAPIDEFLARLAPLAKRLGPFFLQLPATFGPDRLSTLARCLRTLSPDFHYAVEVRHSAFFDEGPHERALDELLGAHGVDRVIFDTRTLFATTATDQDTLDALRKKPRVPVRYTATGRRPFVRFVGDPDTKANAAVFDSWGQILARWLAEGREPYFFVHHPDDHHAPALARFAQARWHALAPDTFPAPPAWPAETRGQLSLF